MSCFRGRKLLSIKTKPAMPADVYEVTDVVERAGNQCRYDLDDLDSHWLKLLNEKRLASGLTPLTEDQMETILAALEDRCYEVPRFIHIDDQAEMIAGVAQSPSRSGLDQRGEKRSRVRRERRV